MSPWRLLRSTSTPTCSSRSRHLPVYLPQASRRADIDPTTPCLPSSTAYDHADSTEAPEQSASWSHTWTPPFMPSDSFLFWITGIDCCHTFGLFVRREVAGPDGIC